MNTTCDTGSHREVPLDKRRTTWLGVSRAYLVRGGTTMVAGYQIDIVLSGRGDRLNHRFTFAIRLAWCVEFWCFVLPIHEDIW